MTAAGYETADAVGMFMVAGVMYFGGLMLLYYVDRCARPR